MLPLLLSLEIYASLGVLKCAFSVAQEYADDFTILKKNNTERGRIESSNHWISKVKQ